MACVCRCAIDRHLTGDTDGYVATIARTECGALDQAVVADGQSPGIDDHVPGISCCARLDARGNTREQARVCRCAINRQLISDADRDAAAIPGSGGVAGDDPIAGNGQRARRDGYLAGFAGGEGPTRDLAGASNTQRACVDHDIAGIPGTAWASLRGNAGKQTSGGAGDRQLIGDADRNAAAVSGPERAARNEAAVY